MPQTGADSPQVSVLVATYNRCTLLPIALKSALTQDFDDFEIVIIDDCSTDDTEKVVAQFDDPRIRYFRNVENQASKHGDRLHVRRCVYELMRGKYFIYLCDDDFWLPTNLLSRQIAAYERYPSLSMVVGSQAHTYPSYITQQMGPVVVSQVSPTTFFTPGILPTGFMTGWDYLDLFATNPHGRNLLDGATLYRREAMIKAGVFATDDGSRWQAGYELKMGPATVGDVYFIDEPCIIAGVDPGNASFRGTQLAHFYDCLQSVHVACRNVRPQLDPESAKKLERIRRKIIRSITQGFILNRAGWRLGTFANFPIDLTESFQETVTTGSMIAAYWKQRVPLRPAQLRDALLSGAPLPVLAASRRLIFLGVSGMLSRAYVRLVPTRIRSRLHGIFYQPLV